MNELPGPEINFDIWTPYCANSKEIVELSEVLTSEVGLGAFALGVMGSRFRSAYHHSLIRANTDLDLVVVNPNIDAKHQRAGSRKRLNKGDWSIIGLVGWSKWIDITRFTTIDPQEYLKNPSMRSIFLAGHWLWKKDEEAMGDLIQSVRY